MQNKNKQNLTTFNLFPNNEEIKKNEQLDINQKNDLLLNQTQSQTTTSTLSTATDNKSATLNQLKQQEQTKISEFSQGKDPSWDIDFQVDSLKKEDDPFQIKQNDLKKPQNIQDIDKITNTLNNEQDEKNLQGDDNNDMHFISQSEDQDQIKLSDPYNDNMNIENQDINQASSKQQQQIDQTVNTKIITNIINNNQQQIASNKNDQIISPESQDLNHNMKDISLNDSAHLSESPQFSEENQENQIFLKSNNIQAKQITLDQQIMAQSNKFQQKSIPYQQFSQQLHQQQQNNTRIEQQQQQQLQQQQQSQNIGLQPYNTNLIDPIQSQQDVEYYPPVIKDLTNYNYLFGFNQITFFQNLTQPYIMKLKTKNSLLPTFPGPLKIDKKLDYSQKLIDYFKYKLEQVSNLSLQLTIQIMINFIEKRNINILSSKHNNLRTYLIQRLRDSLDYENEFINKFFQDLQLLLQILSFVNKSETDMSEFTKSQNQFTWEDIMLANLCLRTDVIPYECLKMLGHITKERYSIGSPMHVLVFMKLESQYLAQIYEVLQVYPNLYLYLILVCYEALGEENTMKLIHNYYYAIMDSTQVDFYTKYLAWILTTKIENYTINEVFKQQISKPILVELAESFYYANQLSSNFNTDQNKYVYHALFPSFILLSQHYQELQRFTQAFEYLKLITDNNKYFYSLKENKDFQSYLKDSKERIIHIFDCIDQSSFQTDNKQQQQGSTQGNQNSNLFSIFQSGISFIKSKVGSGEQGKQTKQNEIIDQPKTYYDKNLGRWVIDGVPADGEPDNPLANQTQQGENQEITLPPPPIITKPKNMEEQSQDNQIQSVQNNEQEIIQEGQQPTVMNSDLITVNKPAPNQSAKARIIKNRYVMQ